jgi:hypothetical protein
VETLVAENTNEGMWRLWTGLAESAFGRSLASVAVKIFSHFVDYEKKRYKSCTVNVICGDNAEINHNSVQN